MVKFISVMAKRGVPLEVRNEFLNNTNNVNNIHTNLVDRKTLTMLFQMTKVIGVVARLCLIPLF
jgi:hypothetical protein